MATVVGDMAAPMRDSVEMAFLRLNGFTVLGFFTVQGRGASYLRVGGLP